MAKDTAPEAPKAKRVRARFVWSGRDGHMLAALAMTGELVIYDVGYAALHPDELDAWVKAAAGAAGIFLGVSTE